MKSEGEVGNKFIVLLNIFNTVFGINYTIMVRITLIKGIKYLNVDIDNVAKYNNAKYVAPTFSSVSID